MKKMPKYNRDRSLNLVIEKVNGIVDWINEQEKGKK